MPSADSSIVFTAFENLFSCIDEAGSKGYLPDPSMKISLTEDHNRANTRAYILAIRSRLTDLGYLPDLKQNRTTETIDPYLKKAVKEFQKDSGLKIRDSWAGPQTWKVLQQLVSFEDQQDPANWTIFKKDKKIEPFESNSAVMRAVYLRLYVLGFFPWKEKLNSKTDLSPVSNSIFQRALNDFSDTACCLKLIKRDGVENQLHNDTKYKKLTIEMLKALFQQDEIINALSRNPGFVRDEKNKIFINAVAGIELWLMGFDVHIGSSYHGRESSMKFSSAMEDFWRQQPGTGDINYLSTPTMEQGYTGETWERLESYDTPVPEFFKRLVQMENQVQKMDDSIEDSLFQKIKNFSVEEKHDLENRIQHISTCIWDGAKRVFLWIKQFVNNIFSKASNMIKNIARFIANRARRYFVPVRKAFEIMYRGAVYLKNNLFPGSLPAHIMICHDRDFDTRIFININGNPEIINKVIQKNNLESACFRAACRISGHLMSIFRQLAETMAAGALGWLTALMALACLGRQIKEIAEDVKMVTSFEINLKESPFSNPVT